MKTFKIFASIAAAFCVLWISNDAFADLGPTCACDTPGEGVNCFEYNQELDMGSTACHNYANRSEFCHYAVRNDNNDLVFHGIWSEFNDKLMTIGENQYSPSEACTLLCDTSCPMVKPLEGSADYEKNLKLYNECLDYYKPQVVDCQCISNETDRILCENVCHNNVLTSKCGSECLHGINYDDKTNYHASNLPDSNHVRRFCSKESYCDSYTSSISVKRPTKWSLLAILTALLAVVTTLMITFFNKSDKINNKKENND